MNLNLGWAIDIDDAKIALFVNGIFQTTEQNLLDPLFVTRQIHRSLWEIEGEINIFDAHPFL